MSFDMLFCRRYINNDTLFSQLTRAAKGIPGYRELFGGNAPVMAERMAKDGADVLLAARLSENTLKSLHPGLRGSYLVFFNNY